MTNLFNLDQAERVSCELSWDRHSECIVPTVKHRGSCVMVWDYLRAKGVVEMRFIDLKHSEYLGIYIGWQDEVCIRMLDKRELVYILFLVQWMGTYDDYTNPAHISICQQMTLPALSTLTLFSTSDTGVNQASMCTLILTGRKLQAPNHLKVSKFSCIDILIFLQYQKCLLDSRVPAPSAQPRGPAVGGFPRSPRSSSSGPQASQDLWLSAQPCF